MVVEAASGKPEVPQYAVDASTAVEKQWKGRWRGPWDDGPANYIPKSAVPCEHAYGRKLYQNSLDRQTEQKFWFGFPSVAILAQVQPIRAAGARASTGLEPVDTARPSAFARRICSFRSAASLANHARQGPHARRFHLQRSHQRLRKRPVAISSVAPLADHTRQGLHARHLHLQRDQQRLGKRPVAIASVTPLADHTRQGLHARRLHLQCGHQRLRKGPVASASVAACRSCKARASCHTFSPTARPGVCEKDL